MRKIKREISSSINYPTIILIEKEIFLSLAVSHETLDIQYADFERH